MQTDATTTTTTTTTAADRFFDSLHDQLRDTFCAMADAAARHGQLVRLGASPERLARSRAVAGEQQDAYRAACARATRAARALGR